MNMCPVQSSTFHMLDDLVCFILLLHSADLRCNSVVLLITFSDPSLFSQEQ